MMFSLRGTLPVLDLDGRRIVDSTAIIAALEERRPEPALYPSEPAERARALALEDFFDEHAGHEMRRAAFWEMRDRRDYLVGLLATGRSAPVRLALRAMLPVGWLYVSRRYTFAEQAAAEARVDVVEALDRIESERAGGDYLVGGAFSIADLAAAALLFPVAWPDELQYAYPDPPPNDWLDSLSAHPAADWIRKIYKRHRGLNAAVNE